MVTEKTPSRTKPLNEVRDIIVDTLTSERVEEEVLARARELHENALNKESLKTAAEESGFPVVSTGFVENRAGIEELDMTGRLSSVLFTLEGQGISDPVPFYLGVAVVQLQDVQEPRQLELAEVSEQIKQRIGKDKKIEQLDREVGAVYRRIQQHKDTESLENYLEGVGLNLESLTYKPGGRLLSYTPFPALDRLVFNIDTPLDVFLDPVRLDDDFVFLRIKTRKIVDRADFINNRELFYEKQLTELKDDYFASLIMQKRDEFEISFNKKLYDEIVEYELQRYK
jgi:hypothetical protein